MEVILKNNSKELIIVRFDILDKSLRTDAFQLSSLKKLENEISEFLAVRICCYKWLLCERQIDCKYDTQRVKIQQVFEF